MKSWILLLAIQLLLFTPGSAVPPEESVWADETTAGAQQDDSGADAPTPEREIDAEEIRSARQQIADDAALSEELKNRILELYDAALSSLDAVESSRLEVKTSEQDKADIAEQVVSLREELQKPEPLPRVEWPDETTADEAESMLARERSRLDAHRAKLRDTEQLLEERAATRNELSRRLGVLDQEIEAIGDELRSVAQGEIDPRVTDATRISLLAHRQRARAEIEALRTKLSLLDSRGKLLPWRIDQAQRREDYSSQLVSLMEGAAQGLRRKDAGRLLRRIREECRLAAEQIPLLKDVAVETEELAERLWGEDGVVLRSEAAARALTTTRKNLTDLDRMVQLTRRKFEAFGHRGSITRWWPAIPDDFPRPGESEARVRQLEIEIPEIQHDAIRLQEGRSETRKLKDSVLFMVGEEQGGVITLASRRTVRDLLDTRRDLLDDLVQQSSRYSNQLIELESLTTRFVSEEKRIRDFLMERLLWVRSVPRENLLPRPTDLSGSLAWLGAPENWLQSFVMIIDRLQAYPIRGISLLALLALLLGGRPWLWKRLRTLATKVRDQEDNSFGATVETCAHTALLALPLPLVLYVVGWILMHAEDSVYLYSAGRALLQLASVAGLMELSRHLLSPVGLAGAHLGWPTGITGLFHKGLLRREIFFLPLIGISIHLMMAGVRIDSPANLQIYNNTLGRIVFVMAMTALGLSLLSLFRPRWGDASLVEGNEFPILQRLYMFTYPVVLICTLIPAMLAMAGYFITGLLLSYQMLKTLWLVVGLLIFSGLLRRWRMTHHPMEDSLAPGELGAAGEQVRKLFRFAVMLAAAIGLFTIWSQAMPTLQIMKRIQLWPSIALIEQSETDPLGPPQIAAAPAPGEEVAPEGEPEAKTPQGILIPTGPSGTAGAEPESSPLTLWHLFESVLAILISVVLVKNMPGLLQLILQRRTSLDLGVRIAVSTLVRYAIIIVGFSIAMGLLGISWSKIQWLAAALTFGLGFGLQEIVANFVSGLILLVERPVRVGDAVTVGELQGRVSRIQIRATTITLWDRSEMIVPNKEFITTKLVNWTLSDSRRRIDIPVRVTYGTDLEKVKATLVKVAMEHPAVQQDPAPQALLLGFGNDAINFELRYFVDFGQGLQSKDEIHMAVDRAFKEHGIEFALPRIDIQLPSQKTPAVPRAVPVPKKASSE